MNKKITMKNNTWEEEFLKTRTYYYCEEHINNSGIGCDKCIDYQLKNNKADILAKHDIAFIQSLLDKKREEILEGVLGFGEIQARPELAKAIKKLIKEKFDSQDTGKYIGKNFGNAIKKLSN